uniref:DUF674 domain-containing protein n=1 Tax=Leersia perrieri TaxID=77586 RepID=A0A0D9UWV8_9ORYZ
MAPGASTSALSMKLLIDTKAQRVLFVEASKDVVDFFVSLLALPIGTAFKLLGKQSMVSCVGNLYTSVEKLDDMYVQDDTTKDAMLRPIVISPATTSTSTSVLRLPPPPPEQETLTLFSCIYYDKEDKDCGKYLTKVSGTACPICGGKMIMREDYPSRPDFFARLSKRAKKNPKAGDGEKGFVQGIATYTVMDDLTVSPLSSISSITLLNAFGVKDLSTLQEKTVQLGFKEASKQLFCPVTGEPYALLSVSPSLLPS